MDQSDVLELQKLEHVLIVGILTGLRTERQAEFVDHLGSLTDPLAPAAVANMGKDFFTYITLERPLFKLPVRSTASAAMKPGG